MDGPTNSASGDDLELAGWEARVAARGVDLLLFWLPPASAALLLPTLGEWPPALLGLFLLGGLLLPVQCTLVATRGQSIGKILLGIRIVGRTGEHPGWIRALVGREAVRFAPWTVPYIGIAGSLVDNLMILNPDRRAAHDRFSDTFVVWTRGHHGTSPRLGDVRDLPAPGTSPERLVAIIAVMAVLLVGGFGVLVLREQRRDDLEAGGRELRLNVDAIRIAEMAYNKGHGHFLAVSSPSEGAGAITGKERRAWVGSPGWTELGWSPAGPVYGTYSVEVDGAEFRVVGQADVDGDGVLATWDGTQMHSARRISAAEVY